MEIKILGNGGALNDGLPYNAFIIDGRFLVETPPDIMQSLYREQVSLSGITHIYISHFHGDHFFGFPFLALRLFYDAMQGSVSPRIAIIGPEKIQEKAEDLCRLAVGDNHPLHSWMRESLNFSEIHGNESIDAGDNLHITPFTMDHFIATWGFTIFHEDRAFLSYFADTLWNDTLLQQIHLRPKIIIADMNGEPDDPVQVHLSEEDVVARALPFCGEDTVFYGTHLKMQKWSMHPKIHYVVPGEVVVIV